MPIGVGIGMGFGGRRRARLFAASFSTLTPGVASTLFGLSHTRGSGATVQTGTSSVVSGLGTDVAGIGRALDSDPLGLVIEETRTNYALRSADIGNAAQWSPVALAAQTSNNDPSPDGTTSTGRISSDGTTATHFVIGPTSVAAGAAVFSAYGLQGTGRWVALYAEGGGAGRYFDMQAGVVGAAGGAATGSIVAAGAYWKCGLAFTATLASQLRLYLASADGTVSFTGTGAYIGLWGMQLENGAWISEYIPAVAANATRAGARIWHPSAATLIDGGRLSLRMVLQAKGANADYSTDPYLWRIDASNYARIASATGVVTTVVGGSSHSTALGVTWAKGDVLDVRLEVGSSRNGVCRIGKNGGALTSLDTSPAAQGALSGSVLDLLQDGSAANVLSCRLRSFEAYRAGGMP